MKIKLILVTILLGLVGCAQEKFIFFPSTLKSNYVFKFDVPHKEYNIAVANNISLNSVLFKSAHSKGVILYLHGNAGNIKYWYQSTPVYLKNNYDVFIVDYRGFGKSNGTVNNEQVLYQDMQKVYDFVKTIYPEKQIIVLGYSLGSGLATKLAADNHPKALFLLAPYYSLPDVVQYHIPFLPQSFIKFKFPTYEFLEKVSSPVYIFHGQDDSVISANSSTRLVKYIKTKYQLNLFENQGHNSMESNSVFRIKLKNVLDTLH